MSTPARWAAASRRDGTVGPQVVGEPGQRAGERPTARAGAHGGRDEPVGPGHVGQVRPGLRRCAAEPQRSGRLVEPVAERPAQRVGHGRHGPVDRGAGAQRRGQQVRGQRQVGHHPQADRPGGGGFHPAQTPVHGERHACTHRQAPPATDKQCDRKPAQDGQHRPGVAGRPRIGGPPQAGQPPAHPATAQGCHDGDRGEAQATREQYGGRHRTVPAVANRSAQASPPSCRMRAPPAQAAPSGVCRSTRIGSTPMA